MFSYTNNGYRIPYRNVFFWYFHSNPACTDIMEIYNAVEEMDDDDEVCLIKAVYCVLMSKL